MDERDMADLEIAGWSTDKEEEDPVCPNCGCLKGCGLCYCFPIEENQKRREIW